jgi:hypothetical protein
MSRGGFTLPGRASLEWAALFSALALIFPLSALIGVGFVLRARHQGVPRWVPAAALALWCGVLGLVLEGVLGTRLLP